jgi:hypothetical protein
LPNIYTNFKVATGKPGTGCHNHVRDISYGISSIHKGRPDLRRIQKWNQAMEKVALHICSPNFGDEKMIACNEADLRST